MAPTREGVSTPEPTSAGEDHLLAHLRDRRRRAAGPLLAGLLLLLVPGCSDPDAAGYTEVVDARLTVDRPAAWSTELTVQQPWSTGFRLAPDSVEQMQLSGALGSYPTAAQAMGTLIGRAQLTLTGFQVVQSRDVQIRGATTGRATRYTLTDNTGSQLCGEWVVAAHWPYPQAVAVSVLTAQFDPELERRVLETMRLDSVLQ